MAIQQSPVALPVDGVHAELNPNELGPTMLSDSENWIVRDGLMKVRRGVVELNNAGTGRPNGFCGYIDGDGTPVLLLATTTKLWAFDDAAQDWEDLSATFTADSSYHTIFRVFQAGTDSGETTTVFVQNGKDAPVKWALPLAPAVASAGAAMPIARSMMILADKMLLGNVVGDGGGTYGGALGPHVVTVSADGDPTTGYTFVAQLSDTPGAIVAMQEIGNLQGVIYKTDAIYLATASDSVDPFTFELKRAGVSGPASPRAVVVGADGLQYYMARDGNVMVFDGIDPKPLGRHIQRYILNTWDVNVFHKVHGVFDQEQNELVFFYCGIGSAEPNRAIVIRLANGSVWPLRWDDLRFTAAVKALLPGGTTIGDVAGAISTLTLTLGEYDALGQSFIFGEFGGMAHVESGFEDVSSPIPAFFQTGINSFDMPLRFKSLRYIDHEYTTADDSQNVSVTVLRSQYGEDLVADSARTIDIGDGGPYRTYHRFPARSYALKISASGSEEIEWQGSVAVFALQGNR